MHRTWLKRTRLTTDGPVRSECECGWKGSLVSSAAEAEKQRDRHLEVVASMSDGEADKLPLADRLVEKYMTDWLDAKTATALASCGDATEYERGKRAGIEEMRHLRLDGFAHDLVPQMLDQLRRAGILERATSRIRVSATGCWVWQGHLNRGYGSVAVDGRLVGAHRWVYEQLVGPIPDGAEVDHLCKVRSCVNPRHLEPVTPATNLQRKTLIGPHREYDGNPQDPTHCVNGHERTAENLRKGPRGTTCRPCHRDASVKHKQRKKRAAEQDAATP